MPEDTKISGWAFGKTATAMQMADALDSYFNSYSAHEKAQKLAIQLETRLHRTTWQNVAAFFIQAIGVFANSDGVDARNRRSHDAMVEIRDFIGQAGIQDRFPL